MKTLSNHENARRVIIFGDSLSSTQNSWPVHIPGAHVNAQPGRSVQFFDLPRDLVYNAKNKDCVVYMLGSNDIGHQTVHNNSAKATEFYLRSHLSALTERGFPVLCVIPPIFGFDNLKKSNFNHRQMFKKIDIPGVKLYDLNKVWDKDGTVDGIHPGAELSEKIALALAVQINLLIGR